MYRDNGPDLDFCALSGCKRKSNMLFSFHFPADFLGYGCKRGIHHLLGSGKRLNANAVRSLPTYRQPEKKKRLRNCSPSACTA